MKFYLGSPLLYEAAIYGSDALIDIKDDFVSWPTDVDSINRIKCGFYRQSNFPNVLGCIDCTHVRIQAPSDDEPSYVNRKGYHSINVQAVCDFEDKSQGIDRWCYSWGQWICLSPLPAYSICQSNRETPAKVQRMPCQALDRYRGLLVRMKPEKVCRIFGACAVLHNIALSRNEPLVNDDGAGVRLHQPAQVPAFLGVQDGGNTREHVARVFFNH
ncbi:HARBI1 [Mytilus edulis]|uniref:HARBI1 n=1 Tax=Mytilus edulis TaxID=6550 RepID=A0A8S3U3T3_MYTED|nr:HARBI1 [Mytilus edulis]